MPSKTAVKRAREDLREGKAPSTAAGEFVKEEIDRVRRGRHGVRSPRQAIAIGLNEARRAGIPLPPPKRGKTGKSTRGSAERAYAKGQGRPRRKASPRASRRREEVLRREPKNTVSKAALSRHAKTAARRSTPFSSRPRSRPRPAPRPAAL